MNLRLSLVIGLAAAAVVAGCKGKSGGETPSADDAAVAQAAHDAAPAAEPLGPPPEPVVAKTDKGDCSTDYAPNPERDRFPMCKIAGGTFMMGSDAKEAPPSEGPPHKVTLSPYLIDQFEVTVAQYVHYLNDLGDHRQCGDPFAFGCVAITEDDERAFIRKEGSRYRAVEGKEHHPVTFMSWPGAKQYCEWVGKRLPTEAEWEFAAIYDPKAKRSLRYPWGDRFFKDRSNCTDKPCPPDTTYLLPVGSFNGKDGRGDGSSPWGVHDMLSNAAEWVADCYEGPYQVCEPTCTDPSNGEAECERHVLRTSILSEGDVLTADRLRSTIRSELPGNSGSISFGFRCATAGR